MKAFLHKLKSKLQSLLTKTAHHEKQQGNFQLIALLIYKPPKKYNHLLQDINSTAGKFCTEALINIVTIEISPTKSKVGPTLTTLSKLPVLPFDTSKQGH